MSMVDVLGRSNPGSTALEVAREDLLASAQNGDAAKNEGETGIAGKTLSLEFYRLKLADGVSGHLAQSLGENVDGVLGAQPALQGVVKQLTTNADQIRAAAAQDGTTEATGTAHIASMVSSR